MKDLQFNIYGFTRPANRAECIELLREMNRMADEMQRQWDEIGAALDAAQTAESHQASA